MDYKHSDNKNECKETGSSRTPPMENWKPGIYLIEQIADFMKQLYEYFYLEKNEIKKLQKNISPELLASFGRQLTETEDINTELHKAVLNWLKFSKEGDACQEEI